MPLAFSGCQKLDLQVDVPECIENKISAFKKSNITCDEGASVTRYTFQEKMVYVFSPGNCIADGGANVYDEACDELCFLGGLAGNLECQGEVFYLNATDETIVWKN